MPGGSGFNTKALIARSGFAAFQFREYRYFWLGAAFSNIGMWTLIYGRLWLMHELTDSPLMVGLVTTSSLGPLLLFSLFGGVVADRANRLKLLRVTRALFAALAVLTGVLVATEVILAWHLIAISVATAVLLSFDIPSRSAMLPALVPRDHLAGAIALYSIVFGGAAVVGPALFVPLVNLWGLEGLFFIIGGSYVLTVGALMFMNPNRVLKNYWGRSTSCLRERQAYYSRLICLLTCMNGTSWPDIVGVGRQFTGQFHKDPLYPQPASVHIPTERSPTIFQGLIDGFRYTGRNHLIAGVLVLAMVVGMFGMPFETLLPELADKIITGGIDTYGRLLLWAGVGGLVATLAIVSLGSRVNPTRSLVISGIGFGLALLALSRVTWFPGAALTIGLIGAFRLVFEIMSTTLIQSLTEDQFRGRVMSIHMFSWGMTALGGLLMGALGQTLGVPFALGLGGLAVAAATVMVTVLTLRRALAGKVLATYSSSTIVTG